MIDGCSIHAVPLTTPEFIGKNISAVFVRRRKMTDAHSSLCLICISTHKQFCQSTLSLPEFPDNVLE